MASPLLADTVTRLGPEAVGAVLVTGSHGGVYAAYLAARAGLRAVIFNDAGIGLEEAGVAGLAWLAERGIAAAAVDHASARIGEAADMLHRGRISRANAQARACGVASGQDCAEAAALLEAAEAVTLEVAPMREARQVVGGRHCRLVLIDSAALVQPEDAGQVVITGSHGALFGGDPANALKADAQLAVFNDAGLGPDEVGASRLPALQGRGIAAVTVAAASARIGDARSALDNGIISRTNPLADALGAREGMALRELVNDLTGL
ncbi:hypothetical protein [Aquibaculum arenosum]|uniref:Uncharacterized protein n=1 Tax=Aquibaculum arenosum TaxID=3032591 RepID=A0ABT5YL42_9PROT|nr:hypothetical protein [Fodinicurvata sp. CAU 1616]MDF2095617.1 hypothetical protein [Fodinicurvata sp. CAU 1616]